MLRTSQQYFNSYFHCSISCLHSLNVRAEWWNPSPHPLWFSLIALPAHLFLHVTMYPSFLNVLLFYSNRSSTDWCMSSSSQPPGAGGEQCPVQQAVLPGLHMGQSPPKRGWGSESHGHPACWERHPHPHHAARSLRAGRLRQVCNTSGC